MQDQLKSVIGKRRKEARSYAADIALFGRMIADDKNMNVDAACQVAHALSTNKVEMEMDYFTAVDDLLPDEESGSDMIGVVEFNSSCFYRYSNINLTKLRNNLGFNDDLLTAAVLGYVEASVKAVPTGKQNSMAAQNPAGYVRAILRNDGFPWSLANAFQKPVRATAEESLEERSIAVLEDYFERLKSVYGDRGITCDTSFNLNRPDGGSLQTVLDELGIAVKEALK
jgi:CRISPR system Cascade subunit CasC